MTTQIAIRLSDDMVAFIDDLVRSGDAGSRAAVVSRALERERRLLSCLKKDEREVLINLLRRVHSNLDAVTAPGEPRDRG